MWKAAVAAVTLVLIVLTIQFWPMEHAEARPLTAAEVRACAKRVLDDWVPDGRVNGVYRRECYEKACENNRLTNYGGPTFCSAYAEDRLGGAARSGTSAGG